MKIVYVCGWVHTAPLTNLSVFVDIFQPFTVVICRPTYDNGERLKDFYKNG